jgi:hypothetical protein
MKLLPAFRGSCLHAMVRPQAEDGDGLQMWTAAALILHNLLRTDDKGWSSILGVVLGLTTPLRKRAACYERLHRT